MAFDSFADFLAMGKHGVYVWSCYGLTFGVIAWLLWHTYHERQQFFSEQKQQMKRDAAQATTRSQDES